MSVTEVGRNCSPCEAQAATMADRKAAAPEGVPRSASDPCTAASWPGFGMGPTLNVTFTDGVGLLPPASTMLSTTSASLGSALLASTAEAAASTNAW